MPLNKAIDISYLSIALLAHSSFILLIILHEVTHSVLHLIASLATLIRSNGWKRTALAAAVNSEGWKGRLIRIIVSLSSIWSGSRSTRSSGLSLFLLRLLSSVARTNHWVSVIVDDDFEIFLRLCICH